MMRVKQNSAPVGVRNAGWDVSRVGMLVDVSRCIGCNSCTVACRQENALQGSDGWLKVWRRERLGTQLIRYDYSQSCRHCADPQCLQACPTGAIAYGAGGVVRHHEEKCIGCQVCVMVCPYGGVKVMTNGKTGKCSLCAHRLAKGEEPACTAVCPTGARTFGEREALVREAGERLDALRRQGLRGRLEGNGDLEGKGGHKILFLML